MVPGGKAVASGSQRHPGGIQLARGPETQPERHVRVRVQVVGRRAGDRLRARVQTASAFSGPRGSAGSAGPVVIRSGSQRCRLGTEGDARRGLSSRDRAEPRQPPGTWWVQDRMEAAGQEERGRPGRGRPSGARGDLPGEQCPADLAGLDGVCALPAGTCRRTEGSWSQALQCQGPPPGGARPITHTGPWASLVSCCAVGTVTVHWGQEAASQGPVLGGLAVFQVIGRWGPRALPGLPFCGVHPGPTSGYTPCWHRRLRPRRAGA